MNILLLGSGGREHALAWKLAQSPLLTNLFIAPGNAGTSGLGTNLPLSLSDFPGIKNAVVKHEINMVVVGPEDPLVNGIHDYFLADPAIHHILVIGPVKQAAMLEGSKDFAK
ncbi:MAG: phosphoribosylamine--glycine ligase family protein, partial [Bacteroidetes bacterium]|nr:phosphoribosylamine--glycine ligase family protein [Bacteroidota bacterium]